jgi:hypothetical protein
MKNIHVLPTDKPSKLVKNNLGIAINEDFTQSILDLIQATFVNIYITSDEEIKEGDWFYNEPTNYVGKILKKEGKFWVCENMDGFHLLSMAKKIILTTDQDLIADGVQAIDDEFLEWFVKNPSCEWVEVEKENICARCHSNDVDECWSAKDCSDGRYDKIRYKIIIPQEEPKQETLEDIQLEEVFGSNYCEFSVVENKLAALYRNQEKILTAIKLLSNGK